MTEYESDVIEAAQDWVDAQRGSQYGPMQHQIKEAEATLMDVVANLAAESEGRWERP